MSKRRGHGEGSIFKRKDGLWVTRVTIGRDARGKVKKLTTYHKTRKEAKEALIKALGDRQRGLPIDPSRQTVADFLIRWLEDSVKGSTRPRTYECYAGVINRHIIPAVGSLRLSKLSPQRLQRLYREKQETGLTRTVQLIHAVLHRALSQALKWGLVPRNVSDAVDRPRVARKEMQVLTPDQLNCLLEAARNDALHALYVMAVTTGLRQGELLALKWSDINLDIGTLQVQRQLQWLKGAASFTEPKSAKSRRSLVLPEMTIASLKKHRVRQNEARLAMGSVWHDNDLIFCSSIGTALNQSNLTKRFHALLAKAGLTRIRFHDLRHTAATLLLQKGVHPKIVQEMLGHSQISLTLDTYSHVLPAMKREAATKMDEILAVAQLSR